MRCVDLLLVNPPIRSYGPVFSRRPGASCPPLGLLALAAAGEETGLSCAALDLSAEGQALDCLLRWVSETCVGTVGFSCTTPAARWVCERGPSRCIIKKAEHGALLRGPEGVFVLPGFPTETVRDPTGAGDSFAGGLMGYAAASGELTREAFCKALAYGTVVASFVIEDFGTERLRGLSRQDIEQRLGEFIHATHLPGTRAE